MARKQTMTLDMDFGMRTPASSYSASLATVAPQQDAAAPAYPYGLPPAVDALRVTDVLDFSGRDLFPSAFGADTQFFTAGGTAETDSSFDLYVPVSTSTKNTQSTSFSSLSLCLDLFLLSCRAKRRRSWNGCRSSWRTLSLTSLTSTPALPPPPATSSS